MKLLKNGAVLLALSLLGCKNPPPKMERCIWNGDGTAECQLAGAEEYLTKQPAELVNYIGTNADDMENFVKWCVEGK